MTDDAFRAGGTAVRLLRIAVPLTASGAVRYGVELSNAYWVGRIGVVGISVVTGLGTFAWLCRMGAGLVTAGAAATVGRFVGEGRREDAARLAQRGITFAALLGALAAALAIAAGPAVLDALRFVGPDRAAARAYLTVLSLGLPITYALLAATAALVGLGHPRASLRANLASLAVACVLTPALVVGARVGIVGAAVAQVAGEAAGLVVALRGFGAHTRGVRAVPLVKRVRNVRALWPLVRVGGPLTIDSVIHAGVAFILVTLLAKYGTTYVAAQGTEERLTQLLNLPTEGLAPAAATLVGYHVGRGERAAARRAVGGALAGVAVCSAFGVAVLLLAPTRVMSLLNDDAGYVDVGAHMLAIAAASLAFLGARDVFESSFAALANAWPTVAVGLAVAIVRVPLALWLGGARGLGGYGVSWALTGTLVAQALVLATWLFARFDAYARAAHARTEADADAEPPALEAHP